MTKTYRDNGAIGALLDEYEKSIKELYAVIRNISQEKLISIVDRETKDEDCRSIQTILSHVVSSGYTYAVSIANHLGGEEHYRKPLSLGSTEEYIEAINVMFRYTEDVFESYPDMKVEEYDNEKKIKVRWGQSYDIDQIMEHAIVHILRHRRQIERFMLKM